MRYRSRSLLWFPMSLILLSGCMYVRTSCTSISPRYRDEQIVTKHRYYISKDSRTSWWKDIRQINKSLQHCQPGVFAADGIPIQVKGRAYNPLIKGDDYTNPARTSKDISFFLASCTCFTMPMYDRNDEARTYSVVVNRDRSLSPIVVRMREESAYTIFSPLAPILSWIWFDWGNPDDENEWVSGHEIGILNLDSSLKKEAALAFALASRLKEFEDTGTDVKAVFSSVNAKDKMTGLAVLPKYKLVSLQKNKDAYTFELSVRGRHEITLAMINAIRDDLAETLLSSYLADEPTAPQGNLLVAYPRFDFRDNRVEGEALVVNVCLEVESSYYDAALRRGKIAIRVSEGQYGQALICVRQNIAKIARDKNIRLISGGVPSEAVFRLGNEQYENGLLIMEFEVE